MSTSEEAYRKAEEFIDEAFERQERTLSLHIPELTKLPESLSRLEQLDTLLLTNTQVTQLPKWIGELNRLTYLILNKNLLSTLPVSIGKLSRLEYLELSSNELKTLPDSIGDLTQLWYLNLSANQLRTLPSSWDRLQQLQSLYLHSNQLTRLPLSLTLLGRLKGLFLHDNQALGIPGELLGPTSAQVTQGQSPANPHAILAFYFAQQKRSAKPLNEVKLLLVGHGRVGKTSLSKALRGVAHDEREPETPGIERHQLSLTLNNSKITAHIWDFGGQEFLHQTHQFFFSERSIYLVVLTGRHGRYMQEAEYWLRLIRTYGSSSPVIIALNQIKGHPFSIDEHFLQENYPEVKAVIRTDCEPRFGIDLLRELLGGLAGGMSSVRQKIDPAWMGVRARLEEMNESFVTFDEYQRICAEEDVKAPEAQETLATILNYLGIALNYRDDPRLRDTSVLKPRWLVDGIYSILRWLHKNETGGEMKLTDFPKALTNEKEYPTRMHPFLLALMEKFELCFPLAEKNAYLVPGLLNENQPRELKKEFMTGQERRIQFRYEDVRPPSLLPRFIVRSHTLSEKQPRWLRGVVLCRGGARALVRGDHDGRLTDVFALGDNAEDRIWLTEFILAEMRVLNDKLPVRTVVENEGAWIDLEVLREDSHSTEAFRTERRSDGGTVKVDIKQTLREVESPEASEPASQPLSLFICYARANERTVRQLIPGLKVLARRGYIVPWRDTDLIPGEDWDETIKQKLMDARIILFMVSREFLASDYVTEHERPLAISLMKQNKAVVVPILLSDCLWQDEDFASLEKLPRKDDPVSIFNRRDAAWTLVEKGLVKVVEKQRKLWGRIGA